MPKAAVSIDLSAVHAAAEAWARQHAAELVDASEAVRARIRELIARAQREGLAPREVARLLTDVVGLDDRRSDAVMNFRSRLSAQGVDPEERDRRVSKYAGAQRRDRAMTIARTETIGALAGGQQALWDHAVGHGIIREQDFRKMWITTPDELLCPLCEALDEVTVAIDAPFPDTDVDGPPLHPNCRCAVGLVDGRGKSYVPSPAEIDEATPLTETQTLAKSLDGLARAMSENSKAVAESARAMTAPKRLKIEKDKHGRSAYLVQE